MRSFFRSIFSAILSCFMLLLGFCPWSLFVVAPEKGEEWFGHVLAALVWIGWFSWPSTLITAFVFVWPSEVVARRIAARRWRVVLRAVAWLAVSSVYPMIIATTNARLFVQSLACAIAGAVAAGAVYILLAPDVHHQHRTTNAA